MEAFQPGEDLRARANFRGDDATTARALLPLEERGDLHKTGRVCDDDDDDDAAATPEAMYRALRERERARRDVSCRKRRARERKRETLVLKSHSRALFDETTRERERER